jgi:hypothetical protein
VGQGSVDDGRSPSPRGIADLLLALGEAGATPISPLVYAACGKPLRTCNAAAKTGTAASAARNRSDAPPADRNARSPPSIGEATTLRGSAPMTRTGTRR